MKIGEALFLESAPFGTMAIGEISSSRWEGERFRASQRGVAAADWVRLSDDGTFAAVDVRMTVETDDGALVFVSYYGRSDMLTGVAYSTPRFETGDERYQWLNHIIAAGRGQFDSEAMTVTYEMFELR